MLPGSVRSPDLVLAAAKVAVINWNSVLESIIVAFAETSDRDQHDHEAIGVAHAYRCAPQSATSAAGPIISASRGQVFITGSGFLPNYPVIVRIT
jgi:hypothetical protein